MACEDAPYSEDYYDLLVSYIDLSREPYIDGCIQNIDKDFDVLYLPTGGLPKLDVANYTYSAIPKCYTLLDTQALEASGILRVQNQPTLSLKGQGVLIGFIDTGIDYQNRVFRNSDGSTRILKIWDQSISGRPPEGFIYGTEYDKAQIDMALLGEEPYRVVPHRDENGHGTFLAGVAAGGEAPEEQFVGAAPYAQLVVVKLKQAKQYLKNFYFIPEGADAYAENDIMAGVSYLTHMAEALGRPLVICLGLGSNSGDHRGNGMLSMYLTYVATKRNQAIAVAAGNEANARHHYFGEITSVNNMERVEVNVGNNVRGFALELWARAPELYSVSIISPTGERTPAAFGKRGRREIYRFVFEGTEVSIDYRLVGITTGDQLIYMRFDRPAAGIWNVEVTADYSIDGHYNMWLPITGLLDGEVNFIRSNPDNTITAPGNASAPMTAGGYNTENNSIYLNSSRGYTSDGYVKPDFTAPAVDVFGPGRRNRFERRTGTSIAAAITAGAAAQYLEWGVERGNNTGLSNAEIKNDFIRGAGRQTGRSYPNREWGANGIIMSS